jgi:hypothetical protein
VDGGRAAFLLRDGGFGRELLRALASLEILFLRSVVSFVLVLAVLPRVGLQSLRTRLFGLHFVR